VLQNIKKIREHVLFVNIKTTKNIENYKA